MKKSILILIVAVFCIQINALSQKAKVGVTSGLTISNMRGTVGGKDASGDSRFGYTFGLILETPLMEHLVFQPGLHYVQKGKDVDQSTAGSNKVVSTALRYAELQLNVLYTTGSNTASFFIGAGPAVSINLPSKFVTDVNGTKTETDFTFGNEGASNLRGFDIGPNVLAGFKFKKGFLFSANYTLGVRNLVPGGTAPDKIRNSSFGIRVGWLFDN